MPGSWTADESNLPLFDQLPQVSLGRLLRDREPPLEHLALQADGLPKLPEDPFLPLVQTSLGRGVLPITSSAAAVDGPHHNPVPQEIPLLIVIDHLVRSAADPLVFQESGRDVPAFSSARTIFFSFFSSIPFDIRSILLVLLFLVAPIPILRSPAITFLRLFQKSFPC